MAQVSKIGRISTIATTGQRKEHAQKGMEQEQDRRETTAQRFSSTGLSA
jgi:hypothetical protein